MWVLVIFLLLTWAIAKLPSQWFPTTWSFALVLGLLIVAWLAQVWLLLLRVEQFAGQRRAQRHQTPLGELEASGKITTHHV